MGFKKKGSYDFDPSLHEDKKQEAFRYQKREEDFRSKRNSKLPKHLQSSYALETDSPNPSFKLPEAPKVKLFFLSYSIIKNAHENFRLVPHVRRTKKM